jgi:hypothetical protein
MSYGKHILSKIREQKVLSLEHKEKYSFVYHTEENWQFQIKYKDIDKYGIVIDYISLSSTVPIMDVELMNKYLEKQADLIQKKITYLLEDFRLIEYDKMNKRVQLRSYPPHKKGDFKYYYEIVVDEGTKLHFQRYEYDKNERRFEKITSQFTLEIFERLLDDLSALLID